MSDADPSIPAGDRTLVVALAARLGMTEWTPPANTLISVGDGETFYDVAVRDGEVAFVETQRGHAVTRATFDSVRDAVGHLVSVLRGGNSR